MLTTIICDESSIGQRYLIIGALIIPRQNHQPMCEQINAWKQSHGLNRASEFKWTKVSDPYLSRYQELVALFADHIRGNRAVFRALIVDTASHHHQTFANGDAEKGFYKAYYHLLLNSLKQFEPSPDEAGALILVDDKHDKYPFRLQVLKTVLNRAMKRDLKIEKAVAALEARKSSGPKAEPCIQIVDILCGAIGFIRNGHCQRPGARKSKCQLVKFIEQSFGVALRLDTNPSARFNLWTFDLGLSMRRKEAYQK